MKLAVVGYKQTLLNPKTGNVYHEIHTLSYLIGGMRKNVSSNTVIIIIVEVVCGGSNLLVLSVSVWPKTNTFRKCRKEAYLNLTFFSKQCNTTMSINCEHCLEMLKNKIKSYVVCVVLYRILKYVFLLRHLACSGYIKRIILSIDNEWCHKVNCAPSSSSFIIVNCGVGCLGGFGVPHWWLWGWKGVENTLKCTEMT